MEKLSSESESLPFEKFGFNPELETTSLEELDRFDINDPENLEKIFRKINKEKDFRDPHLFIEEMFATNLKFKDEANRQKMQNFFKKRDLYNVKQALVNTHSLTPNGEIPEMDNEKLDEVIREIAKIKYFPIIGISAPHIEDEISGIFPGEPTPLLYANAVIDNYVRTDRFPSLKTPETVAIMNPSVYNKKFEVELISNIEKHKPRAVEISNVSEGHYYALKIAEKIKEIAPETIIILGGSHEDGTNPIVYEKEKEKYSLNDKNLAKIKDLSTLSGKKEKELVDFVVSGDAPYLLMQLMKIIADNPVAGSDEIKNKILEKKDIFKQIEGSGNLFFHNNKTKLVENIEISGVPLDRDKLPFIYRGKLSQENRFPIFGGKKTAQVITSFGCINKCEFCHESAETNLYRTKKTAGRKASDVITELILLKERGYKAVFFDDSTFAQNIDETKKLLNKLIEQKRIAKTFAEEISKATGKELELLKKFTNENLENIDNNFLEWGCQTTIVKIDQNLIKQMSEAGCTYIYFGFEQIGAKIDKTKSFTRENEWGDKFKEVAKWCKDAGIRIGVSLMFGLEETPEQRIKTLDFIAHLYKNGYIEKNTVSLNINTPIPATNQWIKLTKKEGDNLPDYKDRLKRHHRFETCHQFSSLQMEEADKIYFYARKTLGDALIGVNFSNEVIEQDILKYKRGFEKDFYFDENYDKYLKGEINGIHLNSASLSAPSPETRNRAEEIFNKEDEFTPEEKKEIFENARQKAAELVNLPDKKGVALARNTTEAASFVFWLADLKAGDNVVLTNAENMSIQRLFELHLDHGNPEKEDKWSAWPTWYAKKGYKYSKVITDKTGVDTTCIEAILSNEEKLKQEITEQINKETKVFCFSHVLRDSGKELPVKEICELVRKVKAEKNPDDPDVFILVDGAQALGNVPKIDFSELGCDAYVGTPHKTMKSEVVGLLYFDPENPEIQKGLQKINTLYFQDQQVVLNGMFDPALNIKSNVKDSLSCADITGFSKAINELEKRGLEKNDFSSIDKYRQELRNYFIEELKNSQLDIEIPENNKPTNFILNFRIKSATNKQIAQKMSEAGMFLSYIQRSDTDPNYQYFRVSFQIDNTKEEINNFITKLKEVVSEFKK